MIREIVSYLVNDYRTNKVGEALDKLFDEIKKVKEK